MIRLLFICSFCLTSASLFAQTKTYTYLIYHKLSPGKTVQDALPVEREWRAVNQAAVDEGNMIGWYMMAKQMTSNPNSAEYDYVTVIVTPTMNIKGGSPAAMAKLYGDSTQARMASLNARDRATAPVVKMEVWETVSALFGPNFSPSTTPVVVLNYMKLRDPASSWAGLIAPMKAVAEGRVKQNEIAGWDLSRLVVPNGSEKGYGMVVAQVGTNAPTIASTTELPGVGSQQTRTFEVVRQEAFRIMEFTNRPGTTAGK